MEVAGEFREKKLWEEVFRKSTETGRHMDKNWRQQKFGKTSKNAKVISAYKSITGTSDLDDFDFKI